MTVVEFRNGQGEPLKGVVDHDDVYFACQWVDSSGQPQSRSFPSGALHWELPARMAPLGCAVLLMSVLLLVGGGLVLVVCGG
jgi:hypothetical protein